MILISILKNENEKVIANDCTLGQAFTMIDNWCTDNNAKYNWRTAFKDMGTYAFIIECYSLDDFDTINIFKVES